MAETIREKSSIPTTAGSPGGPLEQSSNPSSSAFTGGLPVYLLGILPISSVRMRPRTGFRAFSYTDAQRRQNSAPTQRLEPSLLASAAMAGPGSAHARQGDPLMTESLPRIQRHITTATGMPTRLNRPDVAPADSAGGRAGVESVLKPAVAEAPILITEQEVLHSTAAAVTVPSKKTAEQ